MKTQEVLKVAVVQMTSVDDWTANIDWCAQKIQSVSNQNVDVICFPENALYMRLIKSAKIPAATVEAHRFDVFENLAKSLNTFLYFGSVPLVIDGKTYNSTLIFTPAGQRLTPYQKVHLFDIQLAGQEAIRESDEFNHGDGPSILDIKGWKWGLSICYDLRFSELYSKYANQAVDIISVPSAFLVPTGEAHWHTLLRARAIESQAFVVASAQSGSHKGIRETYGHSLIVNPWGAILLDMTTVGVSVMELKKSDIKRVREQIPMSSHRRLNK
jgi:predicted amidohydrolase